MTKERSIVQLELSRDLSRKFRREYALPEQAVSGLRNALITCERSPKQIQNEADQLSDVLSQRRFPATASVVREVRNAVKAMLKEKQDEEVMGDLLQEKLKSHIDYKERHQVDKILKKANFNWRPLAMESKEAAAAYALSRLAPNYAEIARVLDEFQGHDFSPTSVLDYGCGIGAVKEYCMVDPSIALTQMAMDIMRVPSELKLPTALPPATVYAPCPHDLGCPMLKSKYVRPADGHVTCDLCTAFKGIQRLAISRRAGVLYQRTRTRRDGELFPLQMKTVTTESMFDLCASIDNNEKNEG
ncbi:hypothetical protein TELCIR_08060 [Teladorsagia circumcincta]|uniref:Uncharacterized protein n=1 Tax=Teladorsagia circumcincta TaxID=45464 RepID=A0A2G9UIL4_TELCI|nr:hypothetical protein TELCIR_08060 [Teladorsagia circumcincta]